jgi:hypothetical protein
MQNKLGPPEAARGKEPFLPHPQSFCGEDGSADGLISDFHLQNRRENNFFLF